MDYGWTRVTLRYWGRQFLSFLGVLATLLYVGSLVAAVGVGFTLHPFWLALTGVFALERVVTVRARGVRQMALAAPVVIEFVFDIFLQAVQARAFAQAFLGTERKW